VVVLCIFTARRFAAPRTRDPDAADPATTRAAMQTVATAAILTGARQVARASMRVAGASRMRVSPVLKTHKARIKPG
jgi:hypothetical protein